MRDIGKNIKDLRIKNKMTQEQIAEKLFVSRQTVSNYETGKSRPDIDMLIKLAEALNCDIKQVLYGIQADESNQSNLMRFLIALFVTVASGLPLIFWVELEKAARLQYTATVILRSFVQPLFLLLLGLTIMQGIALLTKSKPFNSRYTVFPYLFVLGLVLLYFVLSLPELYHIIKAIRVNAYLQSLSCLKPNYTLHSEFSYNSYLLNKIWGEVYLFDYQNKWIFFAAGILLWLTRPKIRNDKKICIAILLSLSLSLMLYFAGNSNFTLQVTNPEDYIDPPYGIIIEKLSE